MPFKFGPLSIDPVALGSAGNAILGIRDSGKTYTGTLLAEHLFDAGIPFVAFDPIGVWRFLRVPGRGHGYRVVVAGGQHGDLPLSPHSAPAIVEAAMQNGVSLVVDLFSLELSKADWKRIVRDSVRLMLHRNSQHGLRHIFLEEAAEFAPQKVSGGDSGPGGEVYAEIEKLARMGGNSRLGYTLINQRAEEVNKAVLELCDNLFLHRQKGRNSLTALSKWLDVGAVKDHKQIIDTLSTLPTGECWAWLAGSERPVHVKVPPKNSLHPDRRVMRGDADVKAKAAVDVGAFVETMRTTLKDVEEEAKANDPKALRAEIAALKRQLAQQAPAIDPAALAEAEQRGHQRGQIDGYMHALEHILADLKERGEQWRRNLITLPAPIASPTVRQYAAASETRDRKPPSAPRTTVVASQGDASLGKSGLRRMLIALAQRPQGLSRRQLGVRAGLSSRSGTFDTYLSRARTNGWIEGAGEMRITEAGLKALGTYDPLPEGRALLEHWLGELGNSGAARILRALADAYPRSLTRAQVGEKADLSDRSGTFDTYLSRLRTLELIEGRGELRASAELFD